MEATLYALFKSKLFKAILGIGFIVALLGVPLPVGAEVELTRSPLSSIPFSEQGFIGYIEMKILPAEANVGETVTISVNVSNSTPLQENYIVTLKINGVKEESKEVYLGGFETRWVTFTIVKKKAGTYRASFDNLVADFIVKDTAGTYQAAIDDSGANSTVGNIALVAVQSPAKQVNWMFVVGIIASVIIISVSIKWWLTIRSRA